MSSIRTKFFLGAMIFAVLFSGFLFVRTWDWQASATSGAYTLLFFMIIGILLSNAAMLPLFKLIASKPQEVAEKTEKLPSKIGRASCRERV